MSATSSEKVGEIPLSKTIVTNLDENLVTVDGDQTIEGVKTFYSPVEALEGVAFGPNAKIYADKATHHVCVTPSPTDPTLNGAEVATTGWIRAFWETFKAEFNALFEAMWNAVKSSAQTVSALWTFQNGIAFESVYGGENATLTADGEGGLVLSTLLGAEQNSVVLKADGSLFVPKKVTLGPPQAYARIDDPTLLATDDGGLDLSVINGTVKILPGGTVQLPASLIFESNDCQADLDPQMDGNLSLGVGEGAARKGFVFGKDGSLLIPSDLNAGGTVLSQGMLFGPYGSVGLSTKAADGSTVSATLFGDGRFTIPFVETNMKSSNDAATLHDLVNLSSLSSMTSITITTAVQSFVCNTPPVPDVTLLVVGYYNSSSVKITLDGEEQTYSYFYAFQKNYRRSESATQEALKTQTISLKANYKTSALVIAIPTTA